MTRAEAVERVAELWRNAERMMRPVRHQPFFVAKGLSMGLTLAVCEMYHLVDDGWDEVFRTHQQRHDEFARRFLS